MKCPDCGADNPDDSTFCGLCHRRINYLEHSSDPFYPSMYGPGDGRVYGAGGRSAISWKARVKQSLVTLLILLAIASIIVVAAYVSQRFATGDATYSNDTSDITFRYPRSWFQLSPEEALEFLGFDSSVNSGIFLTVFMDKKSKDPEAVMFLGAKSEYASPDDDLGLVLNNFRFKFLQSLIDDSVNRIYPGYTLANLTYSDVTVYGKYPGILIKGNLWKGEAIARTCEILLTTDGRTVYFLELISPPDSGSENTFKKIIDSIEFLSEEKAPELVQ